MSLLILFIVAMTSFKMFGWELLDASYLPNKSLDK
jgi:hypothetical protein